MSAPCGNLVWCVDGTNWLHLLWHATSGGDAIGPFLRRLEACYEQFTPTLMAVAFDTPPSFRHEILPTYKASRPPKPAELVAQLRRAEEAVGELGWCRMLAADNFEADDVLATVAQWACDRGWQCVLASGDKDIRQCLVPGQVTIAKAVQVNHSRVGVDWYTADRLAGDEGLTPAQWIDYQSLVGDSTDDVPGCPGIGPETAKKLLKAAGSLEAAFNNPWSAPVNSKQRLALGEFKKRYPTVRRLVELERRIGVVMGAL